MRTTVINRATGVLRPVSFRDVSRLLLTHTARPAWRWQACALLTSGAGTPVLLQYGSPTLPVMAAPLLQGRLTLLLGPPGAGKSVLLRRLTGQLEDSPTLELSGEVKYNGRDPSTFDLERTAAFVDQVGGW